MEAASYLIGREGGIWRADGARLDPWAWRWVQEPQGMAGMPTHGDARAALTALAATGGARRLPVAVIGPREADAAHTATARQLGGRLAELGLTVLCGGKSGVMTAVCEGAQAAGGLTVGLLPDHDWRAANPAVAIPIATGLSEARNAVIAKAAVALVAVGGSYGTLTEIAYGLHFGKTVIGLCDAPRVEGLLAVPDVETAVSRLADCLLALPGMS